MFINNAESALASGLIHFGAEECDSYDSGNNAHATLIENFIECQKGERVLSEPILPQAWAHRSVTVIIAKLGDLISGRLGAFYAFHINYTVLLR